MEDAAIVSLYWQRDEAAIQETKTKYGAYLGKVAWNILGNQEDCEESVSDTYLRAWESMPPQRPSLLSAYLAKLTRQLSIDRFRHQNRQKRQGSQYALSLTELEDCLSGGDTTGQEVELHLLGEAIGKYLRGLSPEARTVFLGRYWFMDPLGEIARSHGISESKVKSLLYRTRQGLRTYLEKEGFSV